MQDAPQADRAGLTAQTEVISALLRAHASGREAYTRNTAHGLLLRFLETEEAFQRSGDATEQEVIDGLRKVRVLLCSKQKLLALLLLSTFSALNSFKASYRSWCLA